MLLLVTAVAWVLCAVPATAATPVPLPAASTGQWWFQAWRIGDVWASGARGQGITVAIIDTGVDVSRPELRGRVLPGDGRSGNKGWVDDDEKVKHGTQMAILVAGQAGPPYGLTGVAPEAKILPIRKLGSGDQEIRWAVDHGARVLNFASDTYFGCRPEYQSAIRYAVDHGAILVVASGNAGDRKTIPQGLDSCYGVLRVGAVDQQGKVPAWSTPASNVAVAAPGLDIPAVDGNGRLTIVAGTSPASALTSGLVALVWSKHPNLTNRQVMARILNTTRDDASRPGVDVWTGLGIAQASKAVLSPVPADAENQVFDVLDRKVPPSPSPSAVPSQTAAGTPAATDPSSAAAAQTARSTSSSSRRVLVVVTVVVATVALAAIGALVVVLMRRQSAQRRTAVAPPYPPTGAPPPNTWRPGP